MLFYNEYTSFIYYIHLHEKTKFYCYQYKLFIKMIHLLVNSIKIKYTILPSIDNEVVFSQNKLYFYGFFNNFFCSLNKNYKYHTYSILFHSSLINNNIYYLLIQFFNTEFKDKKYMENKSTNQLLKTIVISTNFVNHLFHHTFLQLRKIKAMVYFYFNFDSNNSFLNKLALSHYYLNI